MLGCRTARRFDGPIDRLYALIADIGSYPRFVPGWRAVAITGEVPGRSMVVRQEIGIGGIRASFVSHAVFDPPHGLDISSTTHPFRRFHLRWTLREEGAGTLVEATMEASFEAALLDALAARVTPVLLERTIAAFEREARRRGLLQRGAQHVAGGQ